MKAAVWHGVKDIRVEEVKLRELRDDEVTVKVAWVGICGSDLHEYVEGPVFIPTEAPDKLTGEIAPIILGHEFAGVIEKVGKNVTKFKEGDRVVVNPTLTFGNKPEIVDRYDGFSFLGLHGDGAFANYINVSESTLFNLPDNLTLQDGALVEPTAVAVEAVIDAKVTLGDTVAIFGSGPIGLLTIISARAAGASNIIVSDLVDFRLQKAKEFGATHVINSSKVNPVEAIRGIAPDGVDVSFEIAGVATTFRQAIDVTKAGGNMMMVSIFARPIEWNPIQLTNTGVNILSSICYTPTTFRKTIKAMSTGQLRPQGIVTSKIDLDNLVQDGFEVLIKDKTQAKILVELSGEK